MVGLKLKKRKNIKTKDIFVSSMTNGTRKQVVQELTAAFEK